MFGWFRINSLKTTPRKIQFTVLGTGKVSSYNLFIDGAKVSCSKEVKILGINIVRRPPIHFILLEG